MKEEEEGEEVEEGEEEEEEEEGRESMTVHSNTGKEHSSTKSIEKNLLSQTGNEGFVPPIYLSVCGIDCEMCYTELGLELARVSTNISENVPYFF